jgi:hypothetical protein
MAPTVVPEDMDHMAIPMEERDGVREKLQSVIPSVASEKTQGGSTAASSSEGGTIQEVPSDDAEVQFCFSAVEENLNSFSYSLSSPILQLGHNTSPTSSLLQGKEITSRSKP